MTKVSACRLSLITDNSWSSLFRLRPRASCPPAVSTIRPSPTTARAALPERRAAVAAQRAQPAAAPLDRVASASAARASASAAASTWRHSGLWRDGRRWGFRGCAFRRRRRRWCQRQHVRQGYSHDQRHGHIASNLSDLLALINGPNATTDPYALAATGGGGHTHLITFNDAQVMTLRNGGSVTVMSTSTEAHSHPVTVSCTKK